MIYKNLFVRDESNDKLFVMRSLSQDALNEIKETYDSLPDDITGTDRVIRAMCGKDGKLSGDLLSLCVAYVDVQKFLNIEPVHHSFYEAMMTCKGKIDLEEAKK